MSNPDTAPEYLTAKEFADLVQISVATAYRWALEHPTLPALRVGRTVRFPKDRALQWLRAREQGAPTIAS